MWAAAPDSHTKIRRRKCFLQGAEFKKNTTQRPYIRLARAEIGFPLQKARGLSHIVICMDMVRTVLGWAADLQELRAHVEWRPHHGPRKCISLLP